MTSDNRERTLSFLIDRSNEARLTDLAPEYKRAVMLNYLGLSIAIQSLANVFHVEATLMSGHLMETSWSSLRQLTPAELDSKIAELQSKVDANCDDTVL